MNASAFSSWVWPTPSATNPNDGESIQSWEARRDRVKAMGINSNGLGEPLAITARKWPTPVGRDWKGPSPQAETDDNEASRADRWPTPVVSDSESARNATANRSNPNSKHHSGVTMLDAVEKWPTPATRDYKGSNGPEHLDNGTGRLHLDQLPNYVAHKWSTPSSNDGSRGADQRRDNGRPNSTLPSQIDSWRTPQASDGGRGSMETSRVDPKAGEHSLTQQSWKWATPTARDFRGADSPEHIEAQKTAGQGMRVLTNEATYWQTPSVACATGGQANRGGDRQDELLLTGEARALSSRLTQETLALGARSPNSRLSFYLRIRATTCSAMRSEMRALLRLSIAAAGGRGWTRSKAAPFIRRSFRRSLNAFFVEWLMGWPTGWTKFACSEMGLCLFKAHMRSVLSQLGLPPEAPQAQPDLFG